MDSGFYRGTNATQDVRFSDKEKKLLKQMKFEDSLDSKVNLQKVNLDVIKPWITGKLNSILGLEDDVIVEYVFTQLEEKNINPKVMQINLTGFLNARRAREFMGELWQLLLEAQSSEDGIPISLIDKKMAELKSESGPSRDESNAKSTGSDWSNRYQALTGGRYGKSAPNYASELEVGGRGRNGSRIRRERDPDSPPIPRSHRGEPSQSHRTRHRHRSRSRSRDEHEKRRSPRRRRSTSPHEYRSSRSHKRESSAGSDEHSHKKSKRHRHRSSSSDEDRKHRKKEKKHRREYE